MVMGTDIKGDTTIITAEAPLAQMFGYATDIRSATQGRGTFSMEFASYKQAPRSIQEEVIEKARREKQTTK
jgi:elongation factor G